MVQETMTYIESTPNLEIKLELIDTLRTVTEGKVCRTFNSSNYSINKLIILIYKILIYWTPRSMLKLKGRV